MTELLEAATQAPAVRHLTIVSCTGCGADHELAVIRVNNPVDGPYFECRGRRVDLVPRGTS